MKIGHSYLVSLKSSPSIPKAISRGGVSVCIEKATRHSSRIKLLMTAKSNSGVHEIFGLMLMERITS